MSNVAWDEGFALSHVSVKDPDRLRLTPCGEVWDNEVLFHASMMLFSSKVWSGSWQATDDEGRICSPNSKDAVAWSSTGAIKKVCHDAMADRGFVTPRSWPIQPVDPCTTHEAKDMLQRLSGWPVEKFWKAAAKHPDTCVADESRMWTAGNGFVWVKECFRDAMMMEPKLLSIHSEKESS